MCNSNCSPRERSHTFTATGNSTLDFGEGVYIWNVDVVQGSTNVGSSALLNVQVNKTKVDILDFDGGEADQNTSAAPMRQGNAAETPRAAISGTAVPWYIHDGKVYIVMGGTVATNGSLAVYILASPSPPPWR